MILRQLVNAIRQENWFTVFLEILIVVSGIFIGLQVDDWNDLRKDRLDEQHYLNRLHDEILNAEKLSARLLNRRIKQQTSVFDLLDTVFDANGQSSLTDPQCFAIGTLHYFNIVVSGLSAAEELTASGRMHILRDKELRAALGSLKQAQDATNTYIRIQYLASINLTHAYPHLISVRAYFDHAEQEVSTRTVCDLPGMRDDPAFLNDLSTNADVYDAYVRDGLSPWAEQMRLVHQLIDENLGTRHDAS